MDKFKAAEKIAAVITEETGWQCDVKSCVKDNDIKLAGILIRTTENPKVGVTIYISDPEAKEIKHFTDITSMAREKIELVRNAEPPRDVETLNNVMTDKNEILSRVVLKLINHEMNKDSDKVACPVSDDLAVQFRIPLKDITGFECSITLTDEILDYNGLKVDELYNAALENMKGKSRIVDIKDMFESRDASSGAMYVITNTDCVYGSSMILLEEVQQELLEKLGEGYVVIPSSMDEVIALQYPKQGRNWLTGLIRQINYSALEKKDVLSDHLYRVVDGKLVSA